MDTCLSVYEVSGFKSSEEQLHSIRNSLVYGTLVRLACARMMAVNIHSSLNVVSRFFLFCTHDLMYERLSLTNNSNNNITVIVWLT